ncbi:alkaline phosphatase family protein [Maricaulis sp.]|uniref:nucleotide pyrophosphatase/phosphodiesterase family protein n=1 Tax=Maricaulis sp. TaxID=1486257 RepID=UPI003A8EED94
MTKPRLLLRAITGFALLALTACGHTPAPPAASEAPIVLMIGLDGLRHDAIDRWDAPNLSALAARGVRPQSMYPVMPSKTFTNFYSLATGLYPEHHGMISNAPYDRVFDEIFSNRGGGPQDPRWWAGEPIWITAERQDIRSGIMFWLGSEVEHDGVRPTVWHPYVHEMPYEDRVAEVLSWFDAPAAEQPRLAAVYFDHVDTITHGTGPFTPEEGEAVARVDALVGELVEGLTARGLIDRTNIIIVSDHGMVPVAMERSVAIDTLADLDGLFIPEFSGRYGPGLEPYVMGYGDSEAVDRAYAALDGANEHVSVFRRGAMPGTWHFDHPDRGPDLFILAEPGWLLTRSDADLSGPWPAGMHGTHGYDNRDETMGATFIGAGPIFPPGTRPEAFENVNVYLMIACALGLEPAQTDGDPAEVARITGGRCPAAD